MKLVHVPKTDVGRVRPANEDSIGSIIDSAGIYSNVYIVCDGMGGHVGGARASQTAIRSIAEYFNGTPDPTPNIALKTAIEFANMQIFGDAQSNPEYKGMGTTVTLMVESNGLLYIAHVGDSRIYINTDRELYRITKDHSFVQNLVDAGQLTDAEMETHKRKNELTRALGIAMDVDVDVAPQPIRAQKGDKFLLCSDGLCGLINDSMISAAINTYSDLDSCVDELIQLANNAGGHDNISVDLIEVIESDFVKTTFVDKNNIPNSNTGTQEVKLTTGPAKPKMDKKLQTLLSFVVLIVLAVGGNFLINSSNAGEKVKQKGNEVITSDSTQTTSNDLPNEPIEKSDTIELICKKGWGYGQLSSKLTVMYENRGYEACKECQKIKVKGSGKIYNFKDKKYKRATEKSLKAGDILFVLIADLINNQKQNISDDIEIESQEAIKKAKAKKEKKAKAKKEKEAKAKKEKEAKAKKEKEAEAKKEKEAEAKKEKEEKVEAANSRQNEIDDLLESSKEFWVKKKLDWSISDLGFDLNKGLEVFLIEAPVLNDYDNKEITLYCYNILVKKWDVSVKESISSYNKLLEKGYMIQDNFKGDKNSVNTMKDEIELYKFKKDELVRDGSVMLYKIVD